MTREEARRSTNTSRGVDNLDYIKRIIKRHYAILYKRYDWRHLRILRGDAGKDISAGTRYYDFPVTLDLGRPFKVWMLCGTSQWQEVTQGISVSQYNIYDSDADVRADPVELWDWYGGTQFEAWPLPQTNVTNGFRFEGLKIPEQLTADDSRADLDDVLLSLYAASTLLRDAKQPEAAAERMEAAKALLGSEEAAKGDNSRVVVGGIDPNMGASSRMPRHTAYVRR